MDADIRTNPALRDCEETVTRKAPLIVTSQAWKGNGMVPTPGKDRWENGHYRVVEGLDADNVQTEVQAVSGHHGVIPCQESLPRWFDHLEEPLSSGSSPVPNHAELITRGATPASCQPFTHRDENYE